MVISGVSIELNPVPSLPKAKILVQQGYDTDFVWTVIAIWTVKSVKLFLPSCRRAFNLTQDGIAGPMLWRVASRGCGTQSPA